jgi:hypothetical protein
VWQPDPAADRDAALRDFALLAGAHPTTATTRLMGLLR